MKSVHESYVVEYSGTTIKPADWKLIGNFIHWDYIQKSQRIVTRSLKKPFKKFCV